MPEKEQTPNVKREGWSADEIAEEATNEQPDEILRKFLRGNEKNGKADEHDIAGSINSSETPQGREENKKSEGAKKQNG